MTETRYTPDEARTEIARHESGDCVVHANEDGTLTIIRADPRVLVSVEILDEIRDGKGHPATHLDYLPADHEPMTGAVLTIDGVNRRVIYRIAEQVPDLNAYYAEWPD